MALKYSRRQIAVGLAGGLSIAVPSLSQAPATPVDDMAAARELSKKNRDQIAKFQVPVATEPGFIFKA